MLEEKDLQVIRAIMKEETDAVRQELRQELADTRQELRQERAAVEDRLNAKADEAKQDIMKGVSVLMEQEFRSQFNLLAENQQVILEKPAPLDDLETLETRVSALEAMGKKINREPAQLKKVQ